MDYGLNGSATLTIQKKLWYTTSDLVQPTSVTTWPNWVDLVLLTLLLRTCYIGFRRGFLVELVSVIAVVSATALACNFYDVIAKFLSPWWWFSPAALNFTSFVLLLLVGAVFLASLIVRLFARFLQESQLRRTLPGVGLVLGGVRGVWWSGVLVSIVLAMEHPYLTASIRERSILSPQLVKVTQQSLRWITDRYPGHDRHHAVLIPHLSSHEPSAKRDRRLNRTVMTRASGHATHP